jgi:hypothetical protein
MFLDDGAHKPTRRRALHYFHGVRKNTGGDCLAMVVPFTSRGNE